MDGSVISICSYESETNFSTSWSWQHKNTTTSFKNSFLFHFKHSVINRPTVAVLCDWGTVRSEADFKVGFDVGGVSLSHPKTTKKLVKAHWCNALKIFTWGENQINNFQRAVFHKLWLKIFSPRPLLHCFNINRDFLYLLLFLLETNFLAKLK